MKQIYITRGLDLQLAGAPDLSKAPEKKEARRYAATGADYVGMKPTILVEIGEQVLAGQPLFEDKKNPGVKFVSPVSGVVSAVIRGEKRAFRSIVVEAGPEPTKSVEFTRYQENELSELCCSKVREQLIRSGLWTSLRTRPFSRVPAIDSSPVALFVNVCDTNPHAPDPKPIVEARSDDFIAGLKVLSRICGEKLFVCFGKGDYSPEFIKRVEEVENAEAYQFLGKHPSGLSGTHIAKLLPCGLTRVVWTIGYQDALAIADLFLKGVYNAERIVSLSGPVVKNPRLIRATQGAFVTELVEGELIGTETRVVSGSVLNGRAIVEGEEGLGRYVNQISALADGDPRELFGWITPNFKKFSVARTVGSSWTRRLPFALTTALEGGRRAVFPNPAFEKVTPLDIMPAFLFKALEIGQLERCERLGAFELDEEDLALCTLVDFGKNDYGKTLRALLNKAMKEEA